MRTSWKSCGEPTCRHVARAAARCAPCAALALCPQARSSSPPAKACLAGALAGGAALEAPACLPACLPVCLPACLPALCLQAGARYPLSKRALLAKCYSRYFSPAPAPALTCAARRPQRPTTPLAQLRRSWRGGRQGRRRGPAPLPSPDCCRTSWLPRWQTLWACACCSAWAGGRARA